MRLYISDVKFGSNALHEMEPDGSNAVIKWTSTTGPEGTVYDSPTDTFFFTNWKTIYRINPDGSDQTAIKTISDSFYIGHIDIDSTNGELYYTSPDGGSIRKCDFDGGNDVLVLSPTSPDRVRVDVPGGKCYWVDGTKIYRDTIPGGGDSELLYTDTGTTIETFHLNLVDGKIYWTNYTTDLIRRCNLDGTSVETIFTSTVSLYGMALDIPAGKMYWTDTSPESSVLDVKKANLDGSDVETIWDGAGSGYPRYVLVVGTDMPRVTKNGSYIYSPAPGRSFIQSHHTYV